MAATRQKCTWKTLPPLDALAIIARTPLDWTYLVERARQAGPRRVLSLLLYAESNDLAVPAEAVDQLHTIIHPRPEELAR